MKYNHAAVAGTFDHFHAGHRYLLTEVFENAKRVSLGITADEMVTEKMFTTSIEPLSVRKKTMEVYLQEQNWSKRVQLFTLTTIYGTAITDETLEALYVTTETQANAEKINQIRHEKGLPALEIVLLPLLEGEDDMVISSSRIRLGQIDGEGVSYLQPFKKKKLFTASVLVRDELRSPIGDIIKGEETNTGIAALEVVKRIHKEKPSVVITVGDIVTHSLREQGKNPDVSFIDNRSRRENLTSMKSIQSDSIKHGPYSNKPGTIQSEIVLEYARLLENKLEETHQFEIRGEEDLLGLPAIMLAPLNGVVLYGQVNVGIVYVRIDTNMKKLCYALLERFL